MTIELLWVDILSIIVYIKRTLVCCLMANFVKKIPL